MASKKQPSYTEFAEFDIYEMKMYVKREAAFVVDTVDFAEASALLLRACAGIDKSCALLTCAPLNGCKQFKCLLEVSGYRKETEEERNARTTRERRIADKLNLSKLRQIKRDSPKLFEKVANEKVANKKGR